MMSTHLPKQMTISCFLLSANVLLSPKVVLLTENCCTIALTKALGCAVSSTTILECQQNSNFFVLMHAGFVWLVQFDL